MEKYLILSQVNEELILENIMLKKQETEIYSMHQISKQYYRLFNARDKVVNNGASQCYRLSDGGIEDYVEQFGFKKALEMIKGLQ